ncbi:MAG: NACHT domain-containing protein, partial [Nodosilinea sp.]
MTSQEQRIDGSQIEDSQVQLTQAERDAVSFQNSPGSQVTINNTILRLFGQPVTTTVDWDWAKRLLESKQLTDIRKRLTDTVGRERKLMAVGLQEQLGWVGRSPLEAERVLQVNGNSQGHLDPRQLLIETFGRDDIAGKLLILGTPGAGKTTALLSLAEQLVLGALAQPKTVIPVLFELSTWRKDNQSIRDWLIEQLYEQHGGNRKAKLYEQWLDQQVLLPLLDGLDELGFERQQKCTQKLNEFARQYPKLVVCCRVKEFAQANIKLNTLNGAVCLEPLSNKQIQTYLETQRSPLWSVIESSISLQTLLEPTVEGDPGLLRIPLFVTLAASVYDPKQPFTTKAELLGQYVDRQLSPELRENDRRDNLEKRDWAYKTPDQEPNWRQTERTLSWLARQLQRTNTVEILIEQIQPSWLETKSARRLYRLTLGLTTGLILGLILGLMIALLLG